MNITNEMINEIRNKVDIVEVISKYIPLTQRGKKTILEYVHFMMIIHQVWV